MHEVATDQAFDARGRRHGGGIGDRPGREPVLRQVPLTWRGLGLDTMASLLVESFAHLGKRCFAARCQWPRLHPLNERASPAAPAEDVPLPGLLHPPAAAVGATADGDVMLARAPRGRLVTAPRDPGHPLLLAGRPARMPLLAVLEAGRQAVLLDSGMTAAAVIGLRADVCAPVPSRGALIETSAEPGGSRFLVTAAGRPAATGAVTLWSK
jgi:2-oxo-3-(phosphooxy)propyl 3-oxoalkanoate synthase